MEPQDLELECAEEDKKRGQHKDSNQEVKPWRGACMSAGGVAAVGLERAVADRGCVAAESSNCEPVPAQ